MTALVAERGEPYTAEPRPSDDDPGSRESIVATHAAALRAKRRRRATVSAAQDADAHLPSSIINLPSQDGGQHAGGPPHLTEAQLTALWRGQRFPQGALVTRQGVPVRVIFPGRAGRGAGPDFRGALIAGPSGAPLRGDIELHVRSSMFRAHGHESDAAYAGVVLHVVFEDDTGEDTPLPGGGRSPVVALAPWVATRARELEQWLVRPLLWREPCHDAVARLGADGAAATLDAEGDRRFAAKVARSVDTVRDLGVEQALYAGLLEALGYGGNAPQMASLARLLPWQRLDAAAPQAGAAARGEIFVALLLGCAGLLPSQRGHRGAVDPCVRRYAAAFRAAGLPSLAAGGWKLWGVRPENHPARRIAAAAALLARIASPSASLTVAEAATTRDAVAPLCIGAEGYWRTHFDVIGGACRLPPALIGRSRALEIAINVVLPVAQATGDAALAAAAHSLFARLPRAAAYGSTRFIEEALRGDGGRVAINARRAQGLLELQRNWCTQGGCGRCGLSGDGS